MISPMKRRIASVAAIVTLAATVASPAIAFAGTVKIDGSTSLQPLAQQWATAYHGAHPSVNIVVAGGGSGVGDSDAASGKVDIGMSSQTLSAIPSSVDAVPVARDCVAIINNKTYNNVVSLTAAQVQGIYLGKYKTWKSVGGKTHKGFNANHAIDLVGRTGASGTYQFFRTVFLNNQPQSGRTRAYASSGMVRAAVTRDKYAIGYISMAYINRSVRGVGIAPAKGKKSIGPTPKNVRNGKYPYWRYLYFLRKAGTSWGSEAQAFVNYCLSAAGQKIANISYLSVN